MFIGHIKYKTIGNSNLRTNLKNIIGLTPSKKTSIKYALVSYLPYK